MQINSSSTEPTMLGWRAGDQYSPNILIARRDPGFSPSRGLPFGTGAGS
jgi:hypothetical protein